MVSEEALIQILICLPVISLLRFKSVCKSWFALIGSSSFIAKHLHHRQHDHQHTSFIVWDCLDSPNRFLLVSSDSSTNLLDPPPFFNEGYEGWSKQDLELKMVGSCDGIICLCYKVSCLNLALWNPVTKQFRRLPPSSLHVLPHGNSSIRNSVDYGFGYDVKTNDYKVVRVVLFRDEFSDPTHHLIEVYCLSTDSWKIIDTVLPVDMIISKGTYLNGICFWEARNDFIDRETFLDMYCHLIVTFDMTTEVFGIMPLPDVCGITNVSLKLALIRECIACIHFPVVGEMTTYEIWMLTEFGVKESWSKLYTVQVSGNLLWLSNSGEFFLLNVQNHLVWCHAGTLDMKNLQVKFYILMSDFVSYKESLVSVMG